MYMDLKGIKFLAPVWRSAERRFTVCGRSFQEAWKGTPVCSLWRGEGLLTARGGLPCGVWRVAGRVDLRRVTGCGVLHGAGNTLERPSRHPGAASYGVWNAVSRSVKRRLYRPFPGGTPPESPRRREQRPRGRPQVPARPGRRGGARSHYAPCASSTLSPATTPSRMSSSEIWPSPGGERGCAEGPPRIKSALLFTKNTHVAAFYGLVCLASVDFQNTHSKPVGDFFGVNTPKGHPDSRFFDTKMMI